MAVPTGTYQVEARIDLSPLLGKLEHTQRIALVDPGPEALERCLSRTRSEDWMERRAAADELQWFDGDAARVVPALVGLLLDPRSDVRGDACYSLRRFPGEAAPHTREFLKMILRGDGWDRIAAVYLVAEVAPDEPIVRKVLEQAARSEDEDLARTAKEAIEAVTERNR